VRLRAGLNILTFHLETDTPLAYIPWMWSPDDVSIEIICDGTDDQVVTVQIMTPVGQMLVMAEIVEQGRTLRTVANRGKPAWVAFPPAAGTLRNGEYEL
jgi:hypothetical protein